MKLKPTYTDRKVVSPTLSSKPPLSSIFKEPAPARPSGKLAVSDFGSSALLKPRSRGENFIAPTTPPKANSKAKRATPAQQDKAFTAVKETQSITSPKSSAALRDTIAKAKAAKKQVRESAGGPRETSAETSNWPVDSIDDELSLHGDNKGLLRKRLQQATTSGQLNIAAMKLQEIPAEVTKMYDPENSTTNWAEMVDLTKLNASDNEISKLAQEIFPESIEDDDETNRQFLGLEVLDLHRNLLQQIPLGLSLLERLHTLNVSGNKLTNNALEVVGRIPNLKELYVADNLLEGKLNLSHAGGVQPLYLESLEVLDLHGNALSSQAEGCLLGFKNLKLLNLAGNRFSCLELSCLPVWSLTELNVSKNRLSGLLFECQGDETFDELRILDASYNELEGLAGVSEVGALLPNVRSIILTGNKMRSLPILGNCQKLLTLEVADNQLEEIPSDLAEMETLKSANFANNNIRLVPSELATMASLTSLNLAGNPLREKKYLTMGTSELKLDLEKKLELPQTNDTGSIMDLQTSESPSQYRFSPSNGVLDLSSQSLTTISLASIDLTQGIHTLKLSNNELTIFPIDLLSHPAIKYSLKSLDLSHNPYLHPTEHLTSELFLPNLKSIYIVSTGLTSMDGLTTFLCAPELTELNISCHRLAGHVPWVRAWWPKCTTLLATDNWFTSVDVEGVRGLEVLDIRNNEIEVLPPKLGLLGNLPDSKEKVAGKLRVLEVSGNRFRVPRLTIVEKGTEAVLKDLRRMIKSEEVTEEWIGAL